MSIKLDTDRQWLQDIRRVESPNCDARPDGCDIELVVMHGISLPPKEYGGPHVDQLFTNRLDPSAHPYFAEITGLRVSSHIFIDRQGNVTQYVPFTSRAWHAGISCFNDRECCNDFSIGIELEGSDDEAYETVQYEQAAAIIKELQQHWPGITRNTIVGHADIAPGRKTDPGPAFDWEYFFKLIN